MRRFKLMVALFTALAILVSISEIVSTEGMTPFQLAGRATVKLQGNTIPGHRGGCSGAALILNNKPFIISAGHCSDLTSATVSFMSGKDQVGTVNETANVVLAHDFTDDGYDASVWVGAAARDAALIQAHALLAQLGQLSQFEHVTCSAVRIAWNFQDNDQTFDLQLVSPFETDIGAEFAWPGQPGWKNIYPMAPPSWQGSSGGLCYNQSWQPVGIIVGGLYDGTIPVVPGFMEGPEAISAALTFMRDFNGQVPAPRPPSNPQSSSQKPTGVPTFANWSSLSGIEQERWISAWKANEFYVGLGYHKGTYLFQTDTLNIYIVTDKAFNDDFRKSSFIIVGNLHDWADMPTHWTAAKVESR